MTQSNTEKNFKPLTDHERMLTQKVMDIAYSIHKALGPGLLESVYQKCFCYELSKNCIPFETQKEVSIFYDNLELPNALRLDILVDKSVIIELKAQENYHPVWEAQLLSYLKLTQIRLGYLINFHVPLLKDGIKRMIL